MRIRGRAAACAEIEAGGQDLRATGALRTADLDKRQEGGGRGDEKEGRRDLFGRRRRAGGVPAVSSESVCMASPSARRDSAVFQPLSSSWFAAETGDSWAARSHATHAPPRSVLIQRQQQLQPISPLQAHTPAASGPQRPLKLQSIAVFTVHGIVCIFSRSELRCCLLARGSFVRLRALAERKSPASGERVTRKQARRRQSNTMLFALLPVLYGAVHEPLPLRSRFSSKSHDSSIDPSLPEPEPEPSIADVP